MMKYSISKEKLITTFQSILDKTIDELKNEEHLEDISNETFNNIDAINKIQIIDISLNKTHPDYVTPNTIDYVIKVNITIDYIYDSLDTWYILYDISNIMSNIIGGKVMIKEESIKNIRDRQW